MVETLKIVKTEKADGNLNEIVQPRGREDQQSPAAFLV
jgi:hypothetical protein